MFLFKNQYMLQRLAVHVTLIFLFFFTQIGLATHEISHIVLADKHTQQDKNTTTEQCEQCISYAKVANGLQLSAFDILEFAPDLSEAVDFYANFYSPITTAYAARAPPEITSI